MDCVNSVFQAKIECLGYGSIFVATLAQFLKYKQEVLLHHSLMMSEQSPKEKEIFFLIVSFKNTALPKINQKEEKIKPTHNVHIRHVQNIFSFQVQNQISRKVLCLAPLQLLSKQQIIRCSSSFKYGRGHTMMMPPSLNFSVCYIEDFVIVVMEG